LDYGGNGKIAALPSVARNDDLRSFVIPAKAGIHFDFGFRRYDNVDARLHGHDGQRQRHTEPFLNKIEQGEIAQGIDYER